MRTCSGCIFTQGASHTWDEGTETQAPGCITTGSKTFVCADCCATSTVVIDALGHSYAAPSFQWTEDLSSCTASFTCSVCIDGTENKTIAVPCSISSETTQTPCTSTVTYTASVVLAEEVYTDQQQQSTLLNAHTWGAWSSDGIESHSHTCTACGVSTTEDHDWQNYNCADCGQTDTYYIVNGNTVTIYE